MPAFPLPRSGYLVAVSDGPYDLDGAWEAEAESCDVPAMILVQAWQPGAGAMVVLGVPQGADAVGEYPVVSGDDAAAGRQPPIARVAVQYFEGARAWAFQGQGGTVEVTQYGGGTISGRLAVTLSELQGGDTQLYAAVFERLPVTPPPESGCPMLGPRGSPIDSAAPVPGAEPASRAQIRR